MIQSLVILAACVAKVVALVVVMVRGDLSEVFAVYLLADAAHFFAEAAAASKGAA